MRFFPRATSLLKGATFIDFWFLKNFLRIFNFLFLWLCIKESNYLLFKRGLRLFKGLWLLLLPNVPGATFIQGCMFIPDSRVLYLIIQVTSRLIRIVVSLSVERFGRYKLFHQAGLNWRFKVRPFNRRSLSGFT